MIGRFRRHPGALDLALMLALTFSTGIVDAIGFLGLDRVFAGNMTGNVVILGMALTGADELPVLGPLTALLLFLLGALASGRLLRDRDAEWSGRSTVLFLTVGVILTASAVPLLVMFDPSEPVELAVTGALGLSMGLQAGAARHIGVKDVTTVVVTSTLVGLAFDSRFGARASTHPWVRRASAIALIGAGAGAGALLLRLHIGAGILAAAAITLAVAIIGYTATRALRER